jgi:hypothetical protein
VTSVCGRIRRILTLNSFLAVQKASILLSLTVEYFIVFAKDKALKEGSEGRAEWNG